MIMTLSIYPVRPEDYFTITIIVYSTCPSRERDRQHSVGKRDWAVSRLSFKTCSPHAGCPPCNASSTLRAHSVADIVVKACISVWKHRYAGNIALFLFK